MSEKEKRVRSITRMYYSNPEVQKLISKFGKNREVVPRYFEGFGKRPDVVQYPSEIMDLVNKGATSFHASEELWKDPLRINSEMSRNELDEERLGWDLLIDIDSPFLDCSKIAAKLIIAAMEQYGIKNYGIKFSGSKGFHIIVGWNAFPKFFNETETRKMFPEWPRTISEFLMDYIKKDYNEKVGEILNVEDVTKRTGISKDELLQVTCALSNKPAKRAFITKYKCDLCSLEISRRDTNLKDKLRCLNQDCAGNLLAHSKEEYYYCEETRDPDNPKLQLASDKHPEFFEKTRGISAEKIANLDLILVSSRHLFRMPYSLHEKNALTSVVLKKEDINAFSPNDANPLKIKLSDFTPMNSDGEARKLLGVALDWKKNLGGVQKSNKKQYRNIEISGVTENMFPRSIKNLLNGLKDGKKRGLFVLITFLKTLNFPEDFIRNRISEWNLKNETQLREGYIKSQLDWHFKQNKKILPPNYSNDSYYKDLGILDYSPGVKNPIVEVMKKMTRK